MRFKETSKLLKDNNIKNLQENSAILSLFKISTQRDHVFKYHLRNGQKRTKVMTKHRNSIIALKTQFAVILKLSYVKTIPSSPKHVNQVELHSTAQPSSLECSTIVIYYPKIRSRNIDHPGKLQETILT